MKIFTKDWAEINGKSLGVAVKTGQTIRDIQPRIKRAYRILDIGCGAGVLVNRLYEKGYKAYGYDLSSDNITYARRHGMGQYYSEFPSDQKFNIITMIHTFEHIGNPNEYLMQLRDVLDEPGLIHIILPNNDATLGYFGEQYRTIIYQSDHKTYWDAKSLSQALESTGFKVLKVSERLYFGMLFAVILSKIYRTFIKGNSGKPQISEKPTNKAKLQILFDLIDIFIPCITKVPGKPRIFNEVVITAKRE